MVNYKSHRYIDGRLKWVITDEDGSIINRYPTKEQIKAAILEEYSYGKKSKEKLKGRKCCICGNADTYIDSSGVAHWSSHICDKKDCTRNICYDCSLVGYHRHNQYIIERRKRKICCICGSNKTYVHPNGYHEWHNHLCDIIDCTKFICHSCQLMINELKTQQYLLEKRKGRVCCNCKIIDMEGHDIHWLNCECGKDDCTGYICSKCWIRDYHRLPDSYNSIKKSNANIRTGNLDRGTNCGKAIIDQAVVAKVHNIDDLNIKFDNFIYYIDLQHDTYGKIDVKGSTLKSDEWYFNNRRKIDCDTYFCIEYDLNRNNIDSIFIIPNDGWICNIMGMRIVKNPSRDSKYEQFKCIS